MATIPFLDSLPSDLRSDLIAQMKLETIRRGEFVLTQDEASNDVYFVISGIARATVFSVDGKTIAYREILPGAIFGELSAIDEAPRSASVVAVEDLSVGRISRARFVLLVEDDSRFNWALLRYLAAQARQMTERIFEFSTLLVRDRLVEELIRLAEAGAEYDGWAEISPAPTHFDLASRISTHREAVSREMSKLAKRQVIAKGSGSVFKVDLDALRALRIDRDL